MVPEGIGAGINVVNRVVVPLTTVDLLRSIENGVLEQKEEVAMNTLTTVEEFREFILTVHPIVDGNDQYYRNNSYMVYEV
ncbi:hypothetical protein PPTG_17252 [Phytophthora nicotianae INRA-310]|uniref:Uncharacterized protein n=1 Tax=Phytophthora nicotianae (strain INRA-310) TaxID=761204 RepID=W2PJ87_PHYN3|nr:hypothetical protein PPTG_17252 [Phytophthora nicotianae INRA-310]ETN00922.1 hypothetical protein PPTG_17252 [Phytophthora nicotianae INRA-310]